MPVSAKQLNFCDVSTDFDKFLYALNYILSILF